MRSHRFRTSNAKSIKHFSDARPRPFSLSFSGVFRIACLYFQFQYIHILRDSLSRRLDFLLLLFFVDGCCLVVLLVVWCLIWSTELRCVPLKTRTTINKKRVIKIDSSRSQKAQVWDQSNSLRIEKITAMMASITRRGQSIPWWTTVIVYRLMSWRSTPRSILIDVGYFSIHLNNEITNPTKQDVYQAEWIASSDTRRSDNFIWLLHRQTRERVTIIDLHSSRFPRERER